MFNSTDYLQAEARYRQERVRRSISRRERKATGERRRRKVR